jgi:hypothetical protein
MGQSDFFLNEDDSQSLGDLNYMRMAKKVRRTFPKTLKNPNGFAVERTISSSEDRDFSPTNNGFQTPTPTNLNSDTTFNVESNSNSTPRRVDSSMDMFRNMAKNIGKKK